MDSLILCIQVVFPLLVFMSLGYLLKRKLKLLDSTLKQMNRIVFSVLLPTVLFKNIYSSDISSDINGKLVIFVICSILFSFLFLLLLFGRIITDDKDCASMVQAGFRSNNVLYGVTIVGAIYGEGSALAVASVVAAIAVVIYNVLVVILFELKRHGTISAGKIVMQIVKNPMIIGCAMGAFFLLAGIRLPFMVTKVIADIGGTATPLALIVLGATFSFDGLKKYKGKVILTAVFKLVILPGIVIPLAMLLNFRGYQLACIMSLFASPTAVASFAMADIMGGNSELTGQVIVVTSICSILTIFGWTYLVSAIGFL